MIRRFSFIPRSFRRNLNAFDKYKQQLELKAQAQGLSVDQLVEKSQSKIETLKTQKIATPPKRAVDKSAEQPLPSATTEAIKEKTKNDRNKTQELDAFVDVEKFRQHDAKEIEMLWKARFLEAENEFCGVVLTDTFSRLYLAARKFPTFVLPLPHKEHGVELHYVQWSFVGNHTIHCMLTSLAEYKLHTEYAHPHTTILVHSDFVVDKGLALLNSIVQTNRISLDDAVLLALNLQRFYSASPNSPHGQAKLELLRQFNQGDTNFSVDALIEAAETLD